MKQISRVLGALAMGAGIFLLASTLLSLGTLFAESKAPFWLTAAVALVFLGLYALLFLLGRRLWRKGREPREEEEAPGEAPASAGEGSAEEPEPAAEEKSE